MICITLKITLPVKVWYVLKLVLTFVSSKGKLVLTFTSSSGKLVLTFVSSMAFEKLNQLHFSISRTVPTEHKRPLSTVFAQGFPAFK